MTEQELLEAARRLGGRAVAGIDPERIVAGVGAARRREQRERRFRTWGLLGLAAAAALLLAVWPGHESGPVDSAGAVVAAAPSVLHELDHLTATQLEQVLESMPPAAGSAEVVEEVPFTDVTVQDLERVLQSMEE